MAGAIATQLTGCMTYTSYAYAYSDGPNRETMSIALAIESAVAAATGGAILAFGEREQPWYERFAIGALAPFVIDAAIGLGIGTSDLVGD
ncbi:MAG: hypothetical protein R3B48_17130 [Kofleriaceae bacterium]